MPAITSSKRAWLLHGLTREDLLLEIGPSYSPLAPKRKGWNVLVVDHATREELVAKFVGHDLDVASIEEVDLVWQGEPLDVLLPAEHHGRVAAVLSSHVVEHMPDLLGFLRSSERVLRPGGTVAMAVPDKRRCFDLFRPLSTTADVVLASRSPSGVHSWRTRFEGAAFAADASGQPCWPDGPVRGLRLIKSLAQAFDEAESSADDAYVDAHAWVFTPASFQLVLLELRMLGMTALRVEKWADQGGCEFLVRLVPDPLPVDVVAAELERLELMSEVIKELGASAQALGNAPATVADRLRVGSRRATLTAKRQVRRWQRRLRREASSRT